MAERTGQAAEPAGQTTHPHASTAALLPRRTERLLLRPFRRGDEADALAYRGLADVVRYMPTEPLQASGAAGFIDERAAAAQIKADQDKIVLAIEHDGHVIGDLLLGAGRLADRQAEIGWALHPRYHGRGLAAEAARELLVLAFAGLGMHRVFAQLDSRNAASARLCERLGMRREAYFREDIWFKGEWGDTAVYALLAAEWRAAGG